MTGSKADISACRLIGWYLPTVGNQQKRLSVECTGLVSSQKIMTWMTKLGPSIDYKIVPKESLSYMEELPAVYRKTLASLATAKSKTM